MTGFHVELHGGTALVTIDRPKANAIDAATSKAMGDAFARLDGDPEIRAIILTGAGPKFFSAGWDLAAGEDFDSDYGVGGFGGFPELPNRSTPVIAAVNGLAVGGGFEIVIAADLIVAADHAQFWLPEPALGILPDAGAVKLPRLLPPHVARDLLLTGRRMDAQEAHRWGLVSRVVPADELLAAAHEVATAIAVSAPLSIAALLDIERRTIGLPLDDAMSSLKSLPSYRRAIDSQDAVEGQTAFTERRPPTWTGR
ncbi:MAG: enoyl-CoA hydratase/isomerase family protein [Ilumatobacteraceae bacterium]|nr:enoyl-CoA hydratase/isomerase family protein [Ilumatobacteraceae bacterium]